MSQRLLSGTLALAVAILWADRQAQRPTVARHPLDRLWFDFRDTFGIVWGRRILERLQMRAESERWPMRLTDDGWAPTSESLAATPQPATPLPAAVAPGAADQIQPDRHDETAAAVVWPQLLSQDPRPEQALRWLLRRFVDPEWIDQRLVVDAAPYEPRSTLH